MIEGTQSSTQPETNHRPQIEQVDTTTLAKKIDLRSEPDNLPQPGTVFSRSEIVINPTLRAEIIWPRELAVLLKLAPLKDVLRRAAEQDPAYMDALQHKGLEIVVLDDRERYVRADQRTSHDSDAMIIKIGYSDLKKPTVLAHELAHALVAAAYEKKVEYGYFPLSQDNRVLSEVVPLVLAGSYVDQQSINVDPVAMIAFQTAEQLLTNFYEFIFLSRQESQIDGRPLPITSEELQAYLAEIPNGPRLEPQTLDRADYYFAAAIAAYIRANNRDISKQRVLLDKILSAALDHEAQIELADQPIIENSADYLVNVFAQVFKTDAIRARQVLEEMMKQMYQGKINELAPLGPLFYTNAT